ncbi:alpha/beta fold hydrolase [Micromonospora nigra]|uniref:alpha/beta fold hydrolase n=1 Tax=Micromonospora nigra TaxID=145857 RepID=UPI001112EFBC|nr:alpha/beta fold hydrolase [Micromonospora nigra]
MTVLRLCGVLAFLALGLAVAWSAVFAVARVTTHPGVFLLAGLAAYTAVLALGGWLLTRNLAERPRRRARVVGAAVAMSLVLAPALWEAATPPPEPDFGPPPAGLRYWELPDGTRLAAVRVAGRPQPAGDPVVFLHGGPGVAHLDHDLRVLGQLADTGRDVWLYDQIGAGRSSRLADPTGYSLDRSVSDLEEVRRRIGTERITLIGHSYGATIAATYLARHPTRVSGFVAVSPGRLVPEVGDVSGTGMIERLTPRQRLAVLGTALQPRAMLTWSLVKADPRAAHAFSGDREMDARFATLYRHSAPGLVCEGNRPPSAPDRPGFYANQVPLQITRPAPDIRPALAQVTVPTLLLKGACDYLPWSIVADYRRSIPDSRLVYFARSGHQIFTEQESEFLDVVRAFLADAPLPTPARPDLEPPASFEGPR